MDIKEKLVELIVLNNEIIKAQIDLTTNPNSENVMKLSRLTKEQESILNDIENCYNNKEAYSIESYQVGEPVIYQNGNKFELGIVKTICGNDEYFINYHTGDTAARTHARNLHKISNNYAFHIIRLDPNDNERR